MTDERVERLTHEEFYQHRKALNLTQVQLAHIMGVAKNSIWRWETNGPHGQEIPLYAERMMRGLIGGWRPPEWPLFPGHRRRGPPRYLPEFPEEARAIIKGPVPARHRAKVERFGASALLDHEDGGALDGA